MENVVCINDDWAAGKCKYTGLSKHDFPGHPIKAEIYKAIDIYQNPEYSGYILAGFPGRAYNCEKFRAVDLTFGEVVTEVLKEQIEYETVLNKG